MPTTWIVSADAGRARIFAESDPKQPYIEVEDMVSANARLRDIDINTDRLGPTSAGQSIHNTGGATPNKQYQPAQTPEQHEAEKFAKDIAKYLLEAHRDGRFQQLVISASPHFLGSLRAHLDPQIKPLIKFEVNKDYTNSSAQELREQLRAQLHKQS
jgi:protein required for attachment to host cells